MSSKNNNDKKKFKVSGSGLAIGMCLGISIGLSLWNLTDNPVWLGTFIAIGVCLGMTIGPKKDDEDDNDDEDSNDDENKE